MNGLERLNIPNFPRIDETVQSPDVSSSNNNDADILNTPPLSENRDSLPFIYNPFSPPSFDIDSPLS